MLELIQVNFGYLWLIVALIFLFLELFTPGLFFFIAFALGSVIGAILAFADYSLVAQCLGAAAASLGFFFFLRYLFASKSRSIPGLKTNTEALLGEKGVVIEKISGLESGLVKVRREVWAARSESGATFASGDVVRIVRLEGNLLIVQK